MSQTSQRIQAVEDTRGAGERATISACHANVLNWVQIPESWARY